MSRNKKACTASLKLACLYTKLSRILKQADFKQAEYTPGILVHKTRTHLVFSLVVDNFGVQYTCLEDADFLCNTLTNAGYKITIN